LSFKGKERGQGGAKYDHSNPFDVLMMFPDKCEKEYDIRVDVNDEVLDRINKTVTRDIYKSGMYSTIKDYKYNRETGERERADILGTGESKNVAKKVDRYDDINNIVNYIVDNKDMFKDAKNVYKDALDKKGYTNVNVELKKFDECVDNIINYTDLIKAYIRNNSNVVDEKPDVVDIIIENATSIVDYLGEIMDPSQSDENQIIENANDMIKIIRKFGELYRTLAGKSETYAKMVQKKVNRLSDYNKNKKVVQQDSESHDKSDAVKKNYKDVFDKLSANAQNVLNVVNSVDFNKASDDAIDHFATKGDMVRRISNQLNKVIEFANTIITNGDVDWMNTTFGKIKDVNDICDSVMNTTDAENITDFLVDLDGACRSVVKIARSFQSGSYSLSGAATA
jgi:hypothetical protein